MDTDENGNLKPLMLSDLTRIATETLKEYGDMPVGVEICVVGYEYTEEHSVPVSYEPRVSRPNWIDSYWRGRFSKAFCIEGN